MKSIIYGEFEKKIKARITNTIINAGRIYKNGFIEELSSRIEEVRKMIFRNFELVALKESEIN